MSISNCEVITNNIQSLPDNPTVSSAELKAKFDRTGDDIKRYLNEDLIPGINEELTDIRKTYNSTLLREQRYNVKLSADVEEGVAYILPTTYTVGLDNLKVFYEGCLLIKDIHYSEEGTDESNIITFGWKVPKSSNLIFIVRK